MEKIKRYLIVVLVLWQSISAISQATKTIDHRVCCNPNNIKGKIFYPIDEFNDTTNVFMAYYAYLAYKFQSKFYDWGSTTHFYININAFDGNPEYFPYYNLMYNNISGGINYYNIKDKTSCDVKYIGCEFGISLNLPYKTYNAFSIIRMLEYGMNNLYELKERVQYAKKNIGSPYFSSYIPLPEEKAIEILAGYLPAKKAKYICKLERRYNTYYKKEKLKKKVFALDYDIHDLKKKKRKKDTKRNRMNNFKVQDNTQNLNRYSYALNNPLKYTDPSGYEYEGMSYSEYMDELRFELEWNRSMGLNNSSTFNQDMSLLMGRLDNANWSENDNGKIDDFYFDKEGNLVYYINNEKPDRVFIQPEKIEPTVLGVIDPNKAIEGSYRVSMSNSKVKDLMDNNGYREVTESEIVEETVMTTYFTDADGGNRVTSKNITDIKVLNRETMYVEKKKGFVNLESNFKYTDQRNHQGSYMIEKNVMQYDYNYESNNKPPNKTPETIFNIVRELLIDIL